MSEGIRILKVLHDGGATREEAMEILQVFDEDLKVLAGDAYDSPALRKNLRERYEMNVFKYAFSMKYVNDKMKKLGLPPVFLDPEDYDQSAKDYKYYFMPAEGVESFE